MHAHGQITCIAGKRTSSMVLISNVDATFLVFSRWAWTFTPCASMSFSMPAMLSLSCLTCASFCNTRLSPSHSRGRVQSLSNCTCGAAAATLHKPLQLLQRARAQFMPYPPPPQFTLNTPAYTCAQSQLKMHGGCTSAPARVLLRVFEQQLAAALLPAGPQRPTARCEGTCTGSWV